MENVEQRVKKIIAEQLGVNEGYLESFAHRSGAIVVFKGPTALRHHSMRLVPRAPCGEAFKDIWP